MVPPYYLYEKKGCREEWGSIPRAWERWGGEALSTVLELRKWLGDIDSLITTSVFQTFQDQMISAEKSLYSFCGNYSYGRSDQKTSMCQVYPLSRVTLWNIEHVLWFSFPNNERIFAQFFCWL